MDKSKIAKLIRNPIVIYVVIAIIAIAGYSYAVSLLAVQTPWINVVMGKVSANTVLALVLWTIIIERIGKKRKWGARKVWGYLLFGVLLLVVVVQLTPIR